MFKKVLNSGKYLSNSLKDLFGKPIINNSKPVSEVDDNVVLDWFKSEIRFIESNGWCHATVEGILSLESVVLALKHNTNTEDEWITTINNEWWINIRKHTRFELLAAAMEIDHLSNIKEDKDRNDFIKRCVTVSCILFSDLTPSKLILIDNITVNMLCRYLILTCPVTIDPENSLPGNDVIVLKPFNVNESILRVLENNEFIRMLEEVDNRLPNFLNLYNSIINNEIGKNRFRKEISSLSMLDLFQLKKVISCIFISAGIQIPRDYIHLDMDVIDYCLNGKVLPNY